MESRLRLHHWLPHSPGRRGRRRSGHLDVKVEERFEALGVVLGTAADVDALQRLVVAIVGGAQVSGHLLVGDGFEFPPLPLLVGGAVGCPTVRLGKSPGQREQKRRMTRMPFLLYNKL